jgi:hypothetical protein
MTMTSTSGFRPLIGVMYEHARFKSKVFPAPTSAQLHQHQQRATMSNNAATMPAATEDKPREPSQMVFARMHRDAITANLETSGAQAVYLSYVKRFVAVHLALQELWRMGSMPSERRATWSRTWLKHEKFYRIRLIKSQVGVMSSRPATRPLGWTSSMKRSNSWLQV